MALLFEVRQWPSPLNLVTRVPLLGPSLGTMLEEGRQVMVRPRAIGLVEGEYLDAQEFKDETQEVGSKEGRLE